MEIDDIVTVDPNELTVREPFSSLFSTKQDVLERIVLSMKDAGFDYGHPIHVWRKENCVVDGHQRRLAAIRAGVSVYVRFYDFEDEASALKYAIRNQRDRRNISDAEITRAVKAVDKLRAKGGDRRSAAAKSMGSQEHIDLRDRSDVDTAKIIGTTPQEVKNARAVLRDPEAERAVDAGEKTLNRAAEDVRAKKRKPTAPKPARPKREEDARPVMAKQPPIDPIQAWREIGTWLDTSLRGWPQQTRRDFIIAAKQGLRRISRNSASPRRRAPS
jgi:ParB family chromosome partitioning protein